MFNEKNNTKLHLIDRKLFSHNQRNKISCISLYKVIYEMFLYIIVDD